MTILSTSNHVQRGMISRMIAVVVAKITKPAIRQATQKAKERDSSGSCWERSVLASVFKDLSTRVIGAFGQFSEYLEILENKFERLGIFFLIEYLQSAFLVQALQLEVFCVLR